jgi:hypothetical protein
MDHTHLHNDPMNAPSPASSIRSRWGATLSSIAFFVFGTFTANGQTSTPASVAVPHPEYLKQLHNDRASVVVLYKRPTKSVICFYHGQDKSEQATTFLNGVVAESKKYDDDIVSFFGVDLDAGDGKDVWRGITKTEVAPSKYPRIVLILPGPGDDPKLAEVQKFSVNTTVPFPPGELIERAIADELNVPRPSTTTTPPASPGKPEEKK